MEGTVKIAYPFWSRRVAGKKSNAKLYEEMIQSGWSLDDAAATIDAGILTFDEWKEAHLEGSKDGCAYKGPTCRPGRTGTVCPPSMQ